MAEYTEIRYATGGRFFEMSGDTYVASDITSATATFESSYQFTSTGTNKDGSFPPITHSYAIFTYPETQYRKKRFLQESGYVYVTACPVTRSGTVPSDTEITGLVENSYYIVMHPEQPAGDHFYDAYFKYTHPPELVRWYHAPGEKYKYFIKSSMGAACAIVGKHLEYKVKYTIKAKLTVQTHLAANKPYIERIYGDVNPIPTNVIPAGGFVDANVTNRFSWQFSYDPEGVIDTLYQSSAVISWRNKGAAGWNTIDIAGDTQYYDIPANTFTANEIEWKLSLRSNDNVPGFSDVFTLTTVDTASTAKPLYPVSLYIDVDTDIQFKWDHIIETGSRQTRADLQYSTDEKTWKALATINGAAQYCTISAGTLPLGAISWRVRTYNSNNLAGDWSDTAHIVIRGAPAAPIIKSVSGGTRPVISWQASDQQAYRITINDYDSGALYGAAKEFKTPFYLPDGIAEISIQVQNQFELWSVRTVYSTQIKNIPGSPVKLMALPGDNAVKLVWTNQSELYYIYRDGMLIGRTTENQFHDYYVNGRHTYSIRGVYTNNGEAYYTLSNTCTGVTTCKTAVIAAYDDPQWLPLIKRRGNIPTHDIRAQAQVAYNFYAGFEKPVADISDFVSRTHDFSFTFKNRSDFNKLSSMFKKVVIYKDPYGDVLIGVLDSMTSSGNWAVDVSFSITECQCGEAVAYD